MLTSPSEISAALTGFWRSNDCLGAIKELALRAAKARLSIRRVLAQWGVTASGKAVSPSGTTRLPRHFRRSRETLERAADDSGLRATIYTIADAITRAFRNNGKLMIAGNGGSAADAQHIAGEFLVSNRISKDPLPAIALTADTSVLTAIGNDYGFDHTFERQVRGIGRRGDVLLAISTSGRSPNIVRALKVAQDMGVTTIGFTGDGDREMAA